MNLIVSFIKFNPLFDFFIKQKRLIAHNSLNTHGFGSLERLLCIADPTICHNPSFFQVPYQRDA